MPPRSLVALVALRQAPPLSAPRLVASLGELWPGGPAADHVRQRENVISFFLGEEKVVLSRMPVAIPPDDLAGPCRAAWYWPQAAQALAGHLAHDLVVVVPASADRRKAALCLTKVIAAELGTSPAVGVFWGTSGQVHAPRAFAQAAAGATPQRLPVQLWVAFHLSRESDTTHSLYTSGLEDFGYLEIEVVGSTADPQQLYQRVFDIAHYVLATESVLQPGQTIGASEDEQIAITHGPSICDGRTTVVRLEMDEG